MGHLIVPIIKRHKDMGMRHYGWNQPRQRNLASVGCFSSLMVVASSCGCTHNMSAKATLCVLFIQYIVSWVQVKAFAILWKCRCHEWTWFLLTDCADWPSEGWEGGLRGIVFISFNRHISTLTVDEPLECITVDCSRVVVEGGCFQALKWHTSSFQSAHLLPMARWLRNTAVQYSTVQYSTVQYSTVE